MGLFSTIGKALNNPFVRQVATGLAGVIGGPGAATLVNKGFTLFDGIKSAFEATKSSTPTPVGSGSTLQDPRTVGVGSSSYASTAATESASSASTASNV